MGVHAKRLHFPMHLTVNHNGLKDISHALHCNKLPYNRCKKANDRDNSLPPKYEVQREVIFSVCVSVHTVAFLLLAQNESITLSSVRVAFLLLAHPRRVCALRLPAGGLS